MKQKLKVTIAYVALFGILASCTTGRRVQRMDPETQTDLSGRWNDTDSRLVADEMISDCLSHKWLERWNVQNKSKSDPRPAVIVGLVVNKTQEHIDPEIFITDLERACINDGSVRIVAGGEFRNKIRNERADQQDYASLDTRKEWGKELGADFMLQGTLHQIVDEYKKDKVVYYKVNLELHNLETNEKVWIGDKQIKKGISN
ncbi:MAG: penicillin-binding protein activator LpoB [Bacteroidetes bacterium]|nr:penicillin-binding protein activator LpoB [Bacteroidota bacterium]